MRLRFDDLVAGGVPAYPGQAPAVLILRDAAPRTEENAPPMLHRKTAREAASKAGRTAKRGKAAGTPRGAARPVTDKKRRKKLREKNLAAIAIKNPGLSKQLAEYVARSKLVFDDDGEPDIAFGSHKLYGRPLAEHAKAQITAFFANPSRIVMGVVQPSDLDRLGGRFVHEALRRGHEAGITFHLQPQTHRAVFLTVFGIGLGPHIDPLVEKTKCRYLILVEPNLEFLYHSLEVYDWSRLYRIIDKRHGLIAFLIGDRPEPIDVTIRNVIRGTCPGAFDGYTFFTHYSNRLFDNVIALMQKNAQMTVAGFGFTDDEVFMLRNTYANLCTGDALLSQRTGVRRTLAPIFIIGSGPSLDQAFEVIRANADNAVIFSCGTAIRPLMRAGIVPDFHLEIERNVEVVPLIEQADREFDLSPVCLVVTTTVDPRIPQYFKKKVFFFRPALSCTPIFAKNEESQPSGAGPTVVNAALSFAQDVGFREIYFFGVDLGTKVPSVRHSAHTWHSTEDGFENDIVYSVPIAANFGGVVYSNRDLIWAQAEIENAIRRWGRGRFYYNCSDGARIKGMTARLARAIRLPSFPGGKQKVVDDLMATFPVYNKDDFDSSWTDKGVRKEIKHYARTILSALKKYPDLDSKMYLSEMNKVFLPANRRKEAWAMVFRGSIIMATLGAEYYLKRCNNDPKYGEFKKIVREELSRLTEKIRDYVLDELGDLAKKVPALRRIDPAKAPRLQRQQAET